MTEDCIVSQYMEILFLNPGTEGHNEDLRLLSLPSSCQEIGMNDHPVSIELKSHRDVPSLVARLTL